MRFFLFSVLGLFACGIAASGQTPPPPSPPPLAGQLQQALANLQTNLAPLDSGAWHAKDDDKQAFNDSQLSIQRNLQQAVPGLLAAWRAAPDDLGAAFRLYRDVDAVSQLALQSAAAAQAHAGSQAAPLVASTAALQDCLQQLGAFIETRGSAQFARLQAAAKPPPAAPPPPPQTPPPPKTLVIPNANGQTKSTGPPH